MGARARVGLVEACRGGEARACGMFTMKIVYITHYTPYSVLQDPTYLEVRGASPAGTMRAPRGRLRGCTARPKGAGTQRCAECGRVASCRPSRRDLCCRRRRPSPSRMLSAQTATLAATTLVAVALAFYLLSKSSPEDVPATAAPRRGRPLVCAHCSRFHCILSRGPMDLTSRGRPLARSAELGAADMRNVHGGVCDGTACRYFTAQHALYCASTRGDVIAVVSMGTRWCRFLFRERSVCSRTLQNGSCLDSTAQDSLN